jgi:hypothetical protein
MTVRIARILFTNLFFRPLTGSANGPSIGLLIISSFLAPLILAILRLSAQEPDPTPIQRIELPPERVAAEMERVRRNVLMQMPRSEFEQLVQQAARAEAAGRTPPRLIDAKYRAIFEPNGLVGTAQWKIVHDADGPGRLSLGPLQLAVRSAQWSNHAPVVLGQFEEKSGAGLDLFVDGKGERTLNLEWSARGLSEPGAVRFELRLPNSPLALFELDLPADHSPQVDREEVVLSGPLAADRPDYRRWRLTFVRPGSSGLVIRLTVLTPRNSTQPEPILRTNIQTTQKLTPGQVECEYQLDVQVQRGGIRQMLLDLTPGLRVVDLEAPDLEGWTPVASENGNRIEVRWRDPFRGGRLTLHGLSLLPATSQAWVSPGVQAVGGVSRGERLTLYVHPDLELDAWKPGGFQPITPVAAASTVHSVVLQSRDVGPNVGTRPEAHVRLVTGVFQTRESWIWRVDPDQMSLNVDVQLLARRGRAFQFNWRVPPGWEVEQVESIPANSGLQWNVASNDPSKPALLTIDLNQASANAANSADRHLTIRLRRPNIAWTPGPDGPMASIPVPAFRPDPDVSRDGTLTVRLHPALALAAFAARSLPIDQAVPFRGLPEGLLQIRPRRGRLQSSCDVDVMIGGDRRRATYRLQLTPTTSANRDLLLFVSAPVTFDSWRTLSGSAQVSTIELLLDRSVCESIAPIASVSGWEAIASWSAAHVACGSWWRLTFDRRIQSPTVIEFIATFPTSRRRIEVPLLAVAGTEAFEGRVVVQTAPGDSFATRQVRTYADAVLDRHDGWVRQAFTYRTPPCALTLIPSADDPGPQNSRVDAACLVTQPTDEGKTVYRLHFRLSGWSKGELPIKLPAGASIISLHINGKAAATNGDDKQGAVILPWNSAQRWCDVDLIYATLGPPRSAYSRLQPNDPEIPCSMTLRRIWRLPAGVVPVSLSEFMPLPGGADFLGWRDQWTGTSNVVAGGMDVQRLAESVRRTPPRSNESIGSWLQRLARDPVASPGLIVLDSSALAENDILSPVAVPANPAADAIWQGLGLRPLALPNGILITSRLRAGQWSKSVPSDVAAAIREASLHGHDRVGRFRTLLDWLSYSGTGPVGWRAEDGRGWTDWEAPGRESNSELWVADSWTLWLLGALSGTILAFPAAFFGRRWHFLSAMSAALAGMAMIWLPSYLWGFVIPLLAIGLILLAADLASRLRQRFSNSTANPSARKATVPVAPVIVIAFAAISSNAGPTEPSPVYLIPGSTPGSQTALVSPDLIDSLRSMIRLRESTSGTVLAQSHYDGEVGASTVRWTARFQAYRFGDAAAPLAIGLHNVQLLSAEIDGHATLPRVTGDTSRFVFDVAGRGMHSLVLKFTTGISGESERDVRFSIPELPINSCSMDMPAVSADIQALAIRGIQRTTVDKTKVRFEADLGRVGYLHVRWRQPTSAPVAPTAVQIAHLWEVTESSSRLQSVYRFRLGSAALRGLDFDVPPGIELAEVTPRQIDEPFEPSGPTSVKEWRRMEVAGKHRHHLEFQAPLTGQVQVELELIPQQPQGAKPVLAFPELVGEFETETTAAVRAQDLTARVVEIRGWERLRTDEFLRMIWQPLRVDVVDREPDLAFRRIRQPAPVLRLDLQMPESRASGEQRLNWLIGPGHVELQASAKWSEPPASGPIEWEVPAGITVTDVRGEGLRHWSRSGSRLQAWFDPRTSDRSVAFSLNGVMPRNADEAVQEKTPFVAPVLRQLEVGRHWTQLAVQARDGWRIEPVDIGNFQTLPTTDLPGIRWDGFSAAAGQAVFALRPSAASVQGDVLTNVESSSRGLTWTATINALVSGDPKTGTVQSLAIEATRIGGERPQLTMPAGTRLRETRPMGRGVVWIVDSLPGQNQFVVSGRILTAQTRIAEIPHVAVRGANESGNGLRRWVKLGPGVQSREVHGLDSARIPGGLDALPNGKPAPEPVGWAVTGDAWALKVTDVATGSRDAAPGGLLAEIVAAQSYDHQWSMKANLTIASDSHEPLTVRLPEASEFISASINGRRLNSPGNDGLLQLLAEAAGLHSLEVTWRVASTGESQRLKMPSVEAGGVELAVLGATWSIVSTPDQRVESKEPSLDAARTELQRTTDAIELSRQFGQRLSSDAQTRLGAIALERWKRAELAVAMHRDSPAEPDGQSLPDWLKRLRESVAVSDSPTGIDETSSILPTNEPGIPLTWHLADSSDIELRVTPVTADLHIKAAGSLLIAIALSIGLVVLGRIGRGTANGVESSEKAA